MVELTRITIAALLLVSLAACRDERAWTEEDAWYKPPPAGLQAHWNELPDSLVNEVLALARPKAEAMLLDTSVVRLCHAEAARMTGKLVAGDSLAAYLLRGLYLNRETGGFYVLTNGETVLVGHTSLGGAPVPMSRTGVVVHLERAPSAAYTTVSMAE